MEVTGGPCNAKSDTALASPVSDPDLICGNCGLVWCSNVDDSAVTKDNSVETICETALVESMLGGHISADVLGLDMSSALVVTADSPTIVLDL